MLSERYNSVDQRLADNDISLKNTQEADLEAFFSGFGAEIPLLDMLLRAVRNDIIHSFKPTSTSEIYEKIGKRICEFCDEYVAEA